MEQKNFTDAVWCTGVLRKIRWPDGVRCVRCGTADVRRHWKSNIARQRYMCKCCHETFTDLTGTVFAGSKLPLSVLFRCVHLMEKGLSTTEMAEALEVKWDTALRLRMRFGEARYRSTILRKLRGIFFADGK